MGRDDLRGWVRRYLTGGGEHSATTLLLVRTAGLVAFLTAAWALGMLFLVEDAGLADVQLEADPAAVRDMRADAERLGNARDALRFDVGLLVLYGLTFVLLALLLYRRGGRYRLAGALALPAAIATPVLDFLENRRTLDVLPADGTGVISQPTLDTLQAVSYAKWAVSAMTVLLLGFLFVRPGRSRGFSVLAAITFVAALVGGVAVLSTSPRVLGAYFVMLFAVLTLLAVLLLLPQTPFLRGYRARSGGPLHQSMDAAGTR